MWINSSELIIAYNECEKRWMLQSSNVSNFYNDSYQYCQVRSNATSRYNVIFQRLLCRDLLTRL